MKGHVGLVTSATKVLMGLGQVQELLLLPWGAVGRIWPREPTSISVRKEGKMYWGNVASFPQKHTTG